MTDRDETEHDAVEEVIEQNEPIGDHEQDHQETPGPGALAAPHGIRQRCDTHAERQQVTRLPTASVPTDPGAAGPQHRSRVLGSCGGDVRHEGDDAEDDEQREDGEETERAIGGDAPRGGG